MRTAFALLLTTLTLTYITCQSHKYSKEFTQHKRLNQDNGYSSSVVMYEEEPYDDDDVESAATQQVRRPVYGADENYPVQNAIPIPVRPHPRPQPAQVAPRRPPSPPQAFRQQIEQIQSTVPHVPPPHIRANPRPPVQGILIPRPRPHQVHSSQDDDEDERRNKERLEEEEEEKDEPDRLTMLLPQSKFDCVGKNTGYYADEILSCEVFHYCQENVKHSWICPDGFTFHQVHLICMPPGADNICDKSSRYHFVNEYLYKPVNLEEHQNKPNVSLRYSERFYPDNYYRSDDYEDEEAPQKKPIRIPIQHQPAPSQNPLAQAPRRHHQQQHQQQQQQQQQHQPQTLSFAPAFRPEASGQVFRSSEEVNIPLNYRRPQYVPQRY